MEQVAKPSDETAIVFLIQGASSLFVQIIHS